MREVYNLFSFDSVVQVKRSCYFTDYQFRRPTTSSYLNLDCIKYCYINYKLKTSLIEIMRHLFNHPIHEIITLLFTDMFAKTRDLLTSGNFIFSIFCCVQFAIYIA